MVVADWKETQLKLDVHELEELPIRLDRGTVRRAEITPEGFFRGEAVYCRDGILTYRSPDGRERRELRLPEENKKALADFGLKPVTVEHPPCLLDARNARNFAIGQTDSTTFYDPRSGFVRGVISVFDSDAISSIQNGKQQEISIGYQCEVDNTPGEWNGERYDAIQRNLKINHIALTQKGRAGGDVRVLFDSKDIAYQVDSQSPVSISTNVPTTKRTMDLSRNGLTFKDLPPDVVTFIHTEFEKLDSELKDLRQYSGELEAAARTDADSIENLVTEVNELKEHGQQQKELASELEKQLDKTDSLLEELGLRRDSQGNYYKDAKSKKTKSPKFLPDMEDEIDEEMDEDMEDEDEDEDAEEEIEKTTVKKKKKIKADSVADILKAWKEADKIIPGISGSDRFDSELNVAGIRRLVVAQLRPNRNLEGRNDSYIDALYEELTESAPQHQQRVDHTDSLDTFISLAAKSGSTQGSNTLSERDKALSEAWMQPMAMTRSN